MYAKHIKRLLDLFLTLITMPLWGLLIVFLGIVIFISDKGNPFHNASRAGEKGETFVMYKLRTMKMNAPDIRNEDGSTFNSEDDPRLTFIGKWIRKTSLDEIPQLINVLKGDMSIVGPRPDLPEQIKLYVGEEQRKLEVRPGITGYNQAYFRNTIPWKDRIVNDIYYINHLTFIMDVKVFIKTITSVLKMDSVYVNNEKK